MVAVNYDPVLALFDGMMQSHTMELAHMQFHKPYTCVRMVDWQAAPQEPANMCACANLLWLEIVLPAPGSILLVCHANKRHLDMPVVGVVLQAICKGQAQGLYGSVEMLR